MLRRLVIYHRQPFYHILSAMLTFATQCGCSARPTSCRRVPPHHSGGGVGPASVWGQGSAPISRWTRCGKSWRFAAVTRGGESPSRAPCHRRAVHPRTTRTLRWSLSLYHSRRPCVYSSLFSLSHYLLHSFYRRHTVSNRSLPPLIPVSISFFVNFTDTDTTVYHENIIQDHQTPRSLVMSS